MGVVTVKNYIKREGFFRLTVKKFINGFMDFADKGFWYIGR